MARCIGLMSGTSLDGIDGVLVEFPSGPASGFEVLAHCHSAMPPSLRDELLALNRSGDDELHRAALAANALMKVYAATVRQLIHQSLPDAGSIAAIGAHGQTVRHRPGEFDGVGYTLQLMNGALLAELCGIDVICDFRSADVCAGGQGAPLVPAFHAVAFARPDADVAVLNLGGIANLTLLGHDGRVSGFDCGPGNMLMDGWIHRHRDLPFDADGDWASSGRVQGDLLKALLDEPYFARNAPKSTGRDLFDADWLDRRIASLARSPAPVDVMATLAELTVVATERALIQAAPATRDLLVCGGGSHNRHLMHRLSGALPGIVVRSTAAVGVNPEQVEAAAFAWLANAHLEGRSSSLPSVTGARQPRILGARYPAPMT
jgi:anhydro-N-acetylmuramic acid kinase